MLNPDSLIEIFGLIGLPARIVARLPLFSRYLRNGWMSPWPNHQYASIRFGRRFRWKPWLSLDVQELERLETLINHGTDESIRSFFQAQSSTFQMIAVLVESSPICHKRYVLHSIPICKGAE